MSLASFCERLSRGAKSAASLWDFANFRQTCVIWLERGHYSCVQMPCSDEISTEPEETATLFTNPRIVWT